jgi:hypothetical protein
MLILANKQDIAKAQSLPTLCSKLSVPQLSSLYKNYTRKSYNGKSPGWIAEGPLRLQASSSIPQPESRKQPHLKPGTVSPESFLSEYSRDLLQQGMVWLVDEIKSQHIDLTVCVYLIPGKDHTGYS